MTSPSDTPAAPDVEALARQFHEAYERLAPQFAYKTRKASAVPWEEVPSQNKGLMLAVCGEILASSAAETARLREERDELAGKVYAPDGVGWKQHAIDIAKERPYDRAQVLVLQSRAEHAEARAKAAEAEKEAMRVERDEAVKLLEPALQALAKADVTGDWQPSYSDDDRCWIRAEASTGAYNAADDVDPEDAALICAAVNAVRRAFLASLSLKEGKDE